ncbi:hypothetical protein [Novosphingobium sp. JCM 18896]|uniref:hypothetical protein n=1 Tax=Novosphingobium sp. JCM 18896 TaxID=2989731 RepID=UPI00222187C7|nr:hypothetical protein [Novosphingobium sp. JCM 18896]MCW1431254.1 hypothetical protein [Novosphingobium sp. JCM 18896]
MATRRSIAQTCALAILAGLGTPPAVGQEHQLRAADAECQANGDLVPYCGVPFPEDLEPVPGTASVIASDMHLKMGPSGLEPQPGVLKLVNLRTGTVAALYPARSARPGRASWGDPTCTEEIGARLLPHGLHLSKRRDGAWQLLAVNHGGRESVEFFELTGRAGQWSLRWRGCVVAPASSHLNDVAALPGGAFLVTTMHMGGNAETRDAGLKAARGENTGFLWRWAPGAGIGRQPGSEAPMPNGVQVDAAGRYAYINTASKGGDVRKLDLAQGRVVASVAVPNPDNASWTADGRLLVAGVAAGPKPMACFQHPEKPCPAASEVYAIRTDTMTAERLFAFAGTPLNAATVAVQAGADLLIGSCFGNSVVAVRKVFARRD